LNTAPHIWAIARTGLYDTAEKYPEVPNSDMLMQTGLWLLDGSIFEAVDACQAEALPEIRIRHLIQKVAEQHTISVTCLPDGSFIDCGTPEAITIVNTLP